MARKHGKQKKKKPYMKGLRTRIKASSKIPLIHECKCGQKTVFSVGVDWDGSHVLDIPANIAAILPDKRPRKRLTS